MNTYELFVEVVELKSYSDVAKKLHRSPSAISKQMSMLEQRLGVQLFTRTTRSLEITTAGWLYYERCKDIAQRMADAETELKDLSDTDVGHLTITWPSVLSSSGIVEVLGRFSQRYPGIKVKVKVSSSILNLTEEKVDFAFRVSQLEDSSLVAIKLTSIEPLICATPEIVARYGKPRSMKGVLTLPLLIPTYYNLAQKLRNFFPEIKTLDKEKYHEVDDIHALYTMAKQGMGATFLFRHIVAQDLADGTLVDMLQNVQKLPESVVSLVYPRLNYMPKAMRCFIDFFKMELHS